MTSQDEGSNVHTDGERYGESDSSLSISDDDMCPRKLTQKSPEKVSSIKFHYIVKHVFLINYFHYIVQNMFFLHHVISLNC